MKKIILLLSISLFTLACKNNKSSNKETVEETDESSVLKKSETEKSNLNKTFSWDNLKTSDLEISSVPFFSLPKGMEYRNEKRFDFYAIDFFIDYNFQTYEGETFLTGVKMSRDKNGKRVDWNKILFKKSIDDFLTSNGAKKLYEGMVPREKIKELEQKKGDRYISKNLIGRSLLYDYPITIYALKTKKGNYIIQYLTDSNSGELGILKLGGFNQTIELITAKEIESELKKKGFISLDINFDTGKATIKEDSFDIIDELVKALKSQKDLEVSIDGHTDNVGDSQSNQKLSEERSESVVNVLIDKGIDANRLSNQGYGDSKPISSNNTEEGRAKNRRVEIRKNYP